MHDVLAHRISLVTMHSGLLSYRQDLPEDERRAAVTAIDSNARAALTDLRAVLGVLREDDEGSPFARSAPSPTCPSCSTTSGPPAPGSASVRVART
ncbi:histidine kinase dimerization/phosphoacceptor domain-containing protein [Janibacter limosus]|uniref:histidine kinase dimerization/phosphoacceptor domain-containing protein n=1 Tax=Janibacter limosus TaxID=53458 RepID=UPI0035E108F2|nr:histidine kinase dimerization/phosphoacceptor domain-containing protein [Janibacter limosus]